MVVANHSRNFKGIYSIMVTASKMEEYLKEEGRMEDRKISLFEIGKKRTVKS